jgi:hypothetical protein
MVSLVNSHSNATSRMYQLWEIDLRFAHELPPGWRYLPDKEQWSQAVAPTLSRGGLARPSPATSYSRFHLHTSIDELLFAQRNLLHKCFTITFMSKLCCNFHCPKAIN